MAINILSATENFSDAAWSLQDGALVTVDQYTQPFGFGSRSTPADKLEDPTAVTATSVNQLKNIVNDASTWVCSLFILKDADTTRFPILLLKFTGGTTKQAAVELNTSSGAISDYPGLPPDSSGVVDYDAVWWRLWLTLANNNTGNTEITCTIFPAGAASLGGALSSPVTGTIGAWGANITNNSTLQPYEPEPNYLPVELNVFLMEPVVGSSIF